MPNPFIASANVSVVKVDGEVIPGVQSIEWKIIRNRQNVYNIGSQERIGVDVGPLYVHGLIRVRSTSTKLDEMLLKDEKSIEGKQILVQGVFRTTKVKDIAFDDAYIEEKTFSIDANGVGISVYTFTSTRVRET
jgi:hypothetical protein